MSVAEAFGQGLVLLSILLAIVSIGALLLGVLFSAAAGRPGRAVLFLVGALVGMLALYTVVAYVVTN